MRIWSLPTVSRVLLVLLLVLLIALVAGPLCYRSDRTVVDKLSGQMPVETANQIAQAVNRHASGQAAALDGSRVRPRFIAAQSDAATRTSIYIDFKTRNLVATRARRVNNAANEFERGVVTELPLEPVNASLSKLALSANGVAIVLGPHGNLIGVARRLRHLVRTVFLQIALIQGRSVAEQEGQTITRCLR